MLRKLLCLVFLLAVSSEASAIGHRNKGGCSSSAASSCSTQSSTFTYVPATGKIMPSIDESPTAIVPNGTTYAGTIRVGTAYSTRSRIGLFQRRSTRGGCGN